MRLSLFLFLWLSGYAIEKANIPTARPNTEYTLPFCVTREPYGFLKKDLLDFLKTAFQIEVFIETGTFLGDTAFVAGGVFNEVHTIELSESLYLKALGRFRGSKNIHVMQGDSADVLQKLLKNIPERALFYLDGHYTPGTAKGIDNTPLLRELDAIKDSGKKDSLILIDDIRFCQASLFPHKLGVLALEDYPNLNDLLEALLQINPHYQISVLGDALLAFPQTPNVSVSPVVRACALHRLEEFCPGISQEELEEADHIIANAESLDRKAIEEYFLSYAAGEMDLGYRSYGAMWFGLILHSLGLSQQADALLLNAAKSSLPGWRVNRLL